MLNVVMDIWIYGLLFLLYRSKNYQCDMNQGKAEVTKEKMESQNYIFPVLPILILTILTFVKCSVVKAWSSARVWGGARPVHHDHHLPDIC